VVLAVAAAALTGSAALSHAASTVQLKNDVVRHLDLAQSLGAVSSSQHVGVAVALRNPNEAGESAYLKSLYTPGSPNYQDFLDPAAFNQKFGVSDSDFQAAQSWLKSGGLTVTTIPGTKNYLLAGGTAAQVESLFQVDLGLYSYLGRTFYANDVAPTVPASLPVLSVLGLNDFNQFTNPRVSAGSGPNAVADGAIGSTVPVTGLLSPRALWSIYDLPDSNLGNGQQMAIFGWGTTPDTVTHLRAFEQEFALPQVPVSITYWGDPNEPIVDDTGAQTEWDLDTQASTGMAPNVRSETLFFARSASDADVGASWAAWVNDKAGPMQASASYGECENIQPAEPVIGTDGLEVPGDALLKQAVLEGRTLFASTGDTGSSCPIEGVTSTNGVASQAYPALNYPSASPYAVAVGGTDLTSDGANPPQRFAETGWEYTGGGNSVAEPAGDYQANVAKVNCAIDSQGNPLPPGTLCRSTPDVAAISGDVFTGNGMMITDSAGVDQQGAGTSLSSPLWLGMWTRIQAAKGKKGNGFANYSLYKHPGDFYDVTVGDNQPYPATPGYDNVTGWGTPDVAHLMADISGSLKPAKKARKLKPGPIVTPPQTTCGTLFTDPASDDTFVYQGQTFGAQGAQPQLDILSGKLLLTPDGQTLRTIITVRNLTTDIPSPGGENTYNFVWSLNGQQYFTQLAVEPGGVVNAYDGQVIHLPLLTKYQQLHVDTGTLTTGANGTVEVDVPLANVGGLAAKQVLAQPNATANIRMAAPVGGLFSVVDSAGPSDDYLVGTC
jgi:subtilase family serine protease